jgi:hypothetical protein
MAAKPITKIVLLVFLISLLITSCATPMVTQENPTSTTLPPEPTQTQAPSRTLSPTPSETTEETPPPTETPTITSTPDIRLDPEDWQQWPVVPTVSGKAKLIYQQGLEKGNDPNRFSKVGDCQNITTYFLAIFDDSDQFSLGPEYEYLKEAIDHFSGSYSRESVATDGGMNVASVLSTRWTDKERCDSLETPLACELRLNQPSIVIISMEETWGSNNQVENYEKYMRQVLDTVINFGAVPILATKASNLEGNHQINQVIANLAYEYDIPMWNFWLAVQPLKNHGLLEDGFHLTHGLNFFDNPSNLKNAWPVRNLTALQTIDAVWRQLNGE